MGTSYTEAFNIRKVMYRLQDIDLPFKRGIPVEQFVTFIMVFFLMFVINNIVLASILNIIGIQMPWTFWLVLYVAPPIMASIRIGKPMPHKKSIGGTMSSVLRSALDDDWDCRGMPYGKEPNTGLQGVYLRTWTVDPAYAGVEAPNDLPASQFREYENLHFPDSKVLLPGTKVYKERILESDDEFYERLFALNNIGGVKQEEKTTEYDEILNETAPEREAKIEVPVFNRETWKTGAV